ncbi:MAG: RsmB/NOP family class I SAM-dependent RNA methyltransferase [Pseudomonadota bacterium]
MKLGGRAQAAIEVLSDIEKHKRPVSEALKAWGLDHRFAGSGDRAAIGNLVYDSLRKKASTAFLMDSDKPRRLVFGTLMRDWGFTAEALNAEFDGDKHAPDILTDKEIETFRSRKLADAPDHVQADIPEWLKPSLAANFADDWIDEAQALTWRPPVDLRVNTLKSNREKVQKALARFAPQPTKIALNGLRIAAGQGAARQPNVQADAAFQKGWCEVQDEGSQIVADLVFARAGEQVLDFCAGAGGKTLALSAAMENRGQLHAYDANRSRLKPIYERLKRAGTRNVQVHQPDDDISALVGQMDRVVVDAPCTGTGTWRRHPHAKWKLTKEQLEQRLTEQEEVLSEAAPFVKPGGYFIYITCSILPEENENQVQAFIDDNPAFELLSVGEVWQDMFGFDKPQPWSADMKSITLTPASTGTDGFYFAVMERRPG